MAKESAVAADLELLSDSASTTFKNKTIKGHTSRVQQAKRL